MFLSALSLKNILILFTSLVATALIWGFLSYKLLDVPNGITVDEAAFGYNGVLLAETGKDENGKFMPLFVLSIEGRDWRQPITQYSAALAFKLFGNSLYVLKSVSLVFMVVSTFLIFILGRRLLGLTGGFAAAIIFLIMPIMVIQSHLALDNIAPVPFILIWLLLIHQYARAKKLWQLGIAGIALGISFYSYKAMRLVVPVVCTVTVGYLFLLHFSGPLRNRITPIVAFSLAVLPFLVAALILEEIYRGAVFNQLKPTINSYQQFFLTYLATFDFSFLYIKGDLTPYHSTGKHGALLLATLPIFLVGAYQAVKRRGYFLFLLMTFFTAPILFSLVGSICRASRLLTLVPMYALIVSLGFVTLFTIPHRLTRGAVIAATVVLLAVNFGDFLLYYYNQYPKDEKRTDHHKHKAHTF